MINNSSTRRTWAYSVLINASEVCIVKQKTGNSDHLFNHYANERKKSIFPSPSITAFPSWFEQKRSREFTIVHHVWKIAFTSSNRTFTKN